MPYALNPFTGTLDYYAAADFSADTLHVLRAGDTMTGNLTFSSAHPQIITGMDENLSFMPNGIGNIGISTLSPTEKLDVKGNFQVKDADTATKAYRFRTSGSDLDLDGAGKNLFISVYSNADFTGTQHFYLGFNSGSTDADAFGNWRFHNAPFAGTVFDILPGDPSINSYVYHEFHDDMAHTGTNAGFFSASAIPQPTTAFAAASFTVNAGTAVNDASTFDGYTLKQVVKALRGLGFLA